MRPYRGFVRLGPGDGIRVEDYGVEAYEGWAEGDVEGAPPEELEALRIEAGTPAWGKELDETVLPAEAGLEATHISFTKGCYPGQEPVARLHHRGHPNRGLRVLELENAQPGDELFYEGKVVGRITSAVLRAAPSPMSAREVPEEARQRGYTPFAELCLRRRPRCHNFDIPQLRRDFGRLRSSQAVAQATLAQRCPAEAEVASSNLAGRIFRSPRI